MNEKKIIVALDNNNLESTKSVVQKLKQEAFAFKIGYEFFLNFGLKGYEIIQKENVKIFLDLKLHDIPNTVKNGIQALSKLKPYFTTIHLSGGDETKFSVVRYGNVVGSRGSVLPYFQSLIKNNSKSLPVTDDRMTRFWITLNYGVEFVLNKIDLMRGGELFIPKIPSIKIIDLVKALDKNIKYHIVGIRPGEKVHEVLCPAESSRDTIEFKDHFVIRPFPLSEIDLTEKKINKYKINQKNEKGKFVKENFIYDSYSNEHFLNIQEIRKLI